MEDANNGATSGSNQEKSLRDYWESLVDYFEHERYKKIRKNQQKKTEVKAAEQTVRASWFIVLLTCVIAGIAFFQWQEVVNSNDGLDRMNRIYRGQAAQLNRQAAAMNDLAQRTKDQADRTQTLAEQAVIQAKANQILASNAVATLANTKQSFRDEQRAWIGEADATMPDPSQAHGFPLVITFINSGRTPARNVEVSSGYHYSPTPILGPAPSDLARLTYRPSPSLAPLGKLNETLGYLAAVGDTSSDSDRRGIGDITAHYQEIMDAKLTLYYFGTVKYEAPSETPGIPTTAFTSPTPSSN